MEPAFSGDVAFFMPSVARRAARRAHARHWSLDAAAARKATLLSRRATCHAAFRAILGIGDGRAMRARRREVAPTECPARRTLSFLAMLSRYRRHSRRRQEALAIRAEARLAGAMAYSLLPLPFTRRRLLARHPGQWRHAVDFFRRSAADDGAHLHTASFKAAEIK